jgi:hypothetical protein
MMQSRVIPLRIDALSGGVTFAAGESNAYIIVTPQADTNAFEGAETVILTLTGGIGTAHASIDYNGLFAARYTSEDGFAIMGAAALDLVRARRWAFSVEARVGPGFYGDEDDNGEPDIVGRNVGVGVGFTLFGF